jgi:hypothetical protein
MSSLRQVIEQGQYELAAYRLICGVLQAYLQEHGREASGSARVTEADVRDGHEARVGAAAGG